MEHKRLLPRTTRGQEAYWHMKARKQDAQKLFDEAAKGGATLDEALRFASRQIEAGVRAKKIWQDELRREYEIEELERKAADKRLREQREQEWLEADQGEPEVRAQPFELSHLAMRLWYNSPRYRRKIDGIRAGEYTFTRTVTSTEERESPETDSAPPEDQSGEGARSAEEPEGSRRRVHESPEDAELNDEFEEEGAAGLPEDLEL